MFEDLISQSKPKRTLQIRDMKDFELISVIFISFRNINNFNWYFVN